MKKIILITLLVLLFSAVVYASTGNINQFGRPKDCYMEGLYIGDNFLTLRPGDQFFIYQYYNGSGTTDVYLRYLNITTPYSEIQTPDSPKFNARFTECLYDHYDNSFYGCYGYLDLNEEFSGDYPEYFRNFMPNPYTHSMLALNFCGVYNNTIYVTYYVAHVFRNNNFSKVIPKSIINESKPISGKEKIINSKVKTIKT